MHHDLYLLCNETRGKLEIIKLRLVQCFYIDSLRYFGMVPPFHNGKRNNEFTIIYLSIVLIYTITDLHVRQLGMKF